MCHRNHNATATPNDTRGDLSTRDLRGPIAAAGFSRHACREKSPANPTASTKPPKHLGTLSDPIRIGILLALTKEGSAATPARRGGRAKDLSAPANVTSQRNVLLRTGGSPSKVTLVDGHTRPSIFDVSPSSSTKLEKLMGTLFNVFETKRRQAKVIL